MAAPDPPEIVLPGDPPASSLGRRAWPVTLAAVGLALALLGTLPPQAWSWTAWRPSPTVFVIADWLFLSALSAASLLAIAITLFALWAGRRPIRKGAKKLFEGDLTTRETLLLVAMTAIALGLAIAFLHLFGPSYYGITSLIWHPVDEPAEALAAGAVGPASEMADATSVLTEAILSVLASIVGFGIVATALMCLVVAAMRLRSLARQGAAAPAAVDPVHDELAAAAEEGLEDLEAGGDARAAIIKCYARFERSLAAAETRRAPWQTPLEFMRAALGRLPLDPADVERLTRLFELARFSPHPLGPPEQQAAWRALVSIRAALTTRDTDAPAG